MIGTICVIAWYAIGIFSGRYYKKKWEGSALTWIEAIVSGTCGLLFLSLCLVLDHYGVDP